jgi:hypothetical protein
MNSKLLALSLFSLWFTNCRDLSSSSENSRITPESLSVGLVAYYTFDGDAKDRSGRHHDAVSVRTGATIGRQALNNSAYSFNGSDAIVLCGDILDDVFSAPVARFSVTGWAKTRRCGSFYYGGGFIIGKNAGGNGPYQWNVTHADGVVFAAVVSDTLAHNYLALTSPMATDQWFHFALVFDGGLPQMNRIQLFVDGVSYNTRVYKQVGTLGSSTTNCQQQLTIGATHDAYNPQSFSSFYDGDIDEIRIYSRALTAAEIQALYFLQ